jgi:hypothetical protein
VLSSFGISMKFEELDLPSLPTPTLHKCPNKQRYIAESAKEFVTRLTRRVPLVEQKLLTLPEHLSSPRFLVGFVLLDLLFICMFCRSLFFLLAIVSSVLKFTASDYSFNRNYSAIR